jgi:hypothetical protein
MDLLSSGREGVLRYKRAIFLSFMLALAGLAIWNAVQVFHPAWALAVGSLAILLLLQYVIFHLLGMRWSRQPAA